MAVWNNHSYLFMQQAPRSTFNDCSMCGASKRPARFDFHYRVEKNIHSSLLIPRLGLHEDVRHGVINEGGGCLAGRWVCFCDVKVSEWGPWSVCATDVLFVCLFILFYFLKIWIRGRLFVKAQEHNLLEVVTSYVTNKKEKKKNSACMKVKSQDQSPDSKMLYNTTLHSFVLVIDRELGKRFAFPRGTGHKNHHKYRLFQNILNIYWFKTW